METVIKKFQDKPIKILLKDDIPNMINLIDVCDIIGINAFNWLESDNIKEFILCMEDGYREVHKKESKDRLVFIESSKSVYVHMLIFSKLTFENHTDIYKWFCNHEFI